MSPRSKRGPRRLGGVLRRIAGEFEPATTLARVQAEWEHAAGAEFAARCRPVAERDGVVTVACESAVWAQELELRGPEIVERLSGPRGIEGLQALRAQVANPRA